MNVNEVKSTLPLDDAGNVYMDLYQCSMSPEDFVARFDGATLNHDSLYNHPNATAGWKNQFDAWKVEGVLN